MNQINTKGIVLRRTNFGEADRIVTLLTPDQGKLRLMAKGVRKIKSKLAGGIELFSTSNISFIKGRGEIGTLVSSRLIEFYGNIINDIDKVEQGYGFIKLLDRVTEDMPEPEYYELLEKTLEALNRSTVPLKLVTIWFWAQLLKLAGHTPNLKLDYTGNNLETTKVYFFDFETMHFTSNEQGKFSASDIKFLRLLFDRHNPDVLSRIQNLDGLLSDSLPLVETMLKTHIRI